MKPLKKILKRYDARQKAFQATQASLRPDQKTAFRRPGSMKLKT